MSSKKSIEICLGRISDLKQQIREYHNEMKSNPDRAIEYMQTIEGIEIEIIKNIEKINNK
tara:strand:+ start:187 stop:366 length:180 start_codon:yes stop_codon:yes gene_type:complete